MRYSLLLLLMVFSFAIEPSFVQELAKSKASEQLSGFKSYSISIIQEPYGSDEISENEVTLGSFEMKPGIMVINLMATVDGKQKEFRYLAKVNVYDDVLVLKESAITDRVFDPSITEGRLEDVTALFDAGIEWVKPTESIVGQRFSRTVKKGSILLKETLEKLPEVLKGDTVKVTIIDGGVELTCEVVALEDGYIGNTIDVMHTQYKRKIAALVKGIKELEIKN